MMNNYPNGLMSFWTREEWAKLKNRRTDHYAKLRNNMEGLEDQRRPVPMVRCRTAPNMLRCKTEYTESFKVWVGPYLSRKRTSSTLSLWCCQAQFSVGVVKEKFYAKATHYFFIFFLDFIISAWDYFQKTSQTIKMIGTLSIVRWW